VENWRADVAAAGLGKAEGSQPFGKGRVDIIERGEPVGANTVRARRGAPWNMRVKTQAGVRKRGRLDSPGYVNLRLALGSCRVKLVALPHDGEVGRKAGGAIGDASGVLHSLVRQ
jgi:hypothetical protein